MTDLYRITPVWVTSISSYVTVAILLTRLVALQCTSTVKFVAYSLLHCFSFTFFSTPSPVDIAQHTSVDQGRIYSIKIQALTSVVNKAPNDGLLERQCL
jgi:hypothetical protein